MISYNGDGETVTIPLIIDNESVITDTIFEIHKPATGELHSRCAGASVDDVNRAVAAAKAAFPGWKKTNPYTRRALLSKVADIMLSRKEELIQIQIEETGAARMFVEMSFRAGVNFVRDFASMIPSVEGKVPTVSIDGETAMIVKEPYGVVLGIAPWNSPYILGIRAIALPLAAGNTVILKGSELSPKCFWALGDVYREAGLPAGCLNVIYHQASDAALVTDTLIAHPDVRKISFTGSTNVGAIIGSTAGRYIKPVLLELGGKASAIVLDDADLDKAAFNCALGAFMHSGQICMSTERIIVEHSVAAKFQELLVDATERTFGKNTPVQLLVTTSAVKKNREMVSDALSKGADIVYGNVGESDTSAHGLRPVIVGGVTKEMDLYYNESFGPTVSLFVVDNEEEAIRVANDTEYGLTSAVFTKNLFRGLRVADQIQSGAVHINSLTVHDEPTLPHGGWKSSGFGRFGGTSGYDEWLQTKTITWME